MLHRPRANALTTEPRAQLKEKYCHQILKHHKSIVIAILVTHIRLKKTYLGDWDQCTFCIADIAHISRGSSQTE